MPTTQTLHAGAVGTLPASAFITYAGMGDTAAAAARNTDACNPRLNLALLEYTNAATTAATHKNGTCKLAGNSIQLPATKSAAAHVAEMRRLRAYRSEQYTSELQ